MNTDRIRPLLDCPADRKPRASLFLSGTGSNARRILETHTATTNPHYTIVALITDRPKRSSAYELGKAYNIPVVENDISAFYRAHGLGRVSLSSEKGREVRKKWTTQLRDQIMSLEVDFGILAGFMSLTNIVNDFPCINVHPGDLTYVHNGERYLTGLHTVPIEKALLADFTELRSSVILATSYTGHGCGMDSGPVLGLSQRVPIQWNGHTAQELQRVFDKRPAEKPRGGYNDVLAQLADVNLDRLKRYGDWTVFPSAVSDFAGGYFSVDSAGNLLYFTNHAWYVIKTVVYKNDERQILFR